MGHKTDCKGKCMILGCKCRKYITAKAVKGAK
jgi:hypothetical protein